MKITQMSSARTGKAVANQFIITSYDENGAMTEVFQSYKSVIAKVSYNNGKPVTTLDTVYWNYSKTTSKYRSQFLGETTKETQAKIDSGEYVLANLN